MKTTLPILILTAVLASTINSAQAQTNTENYIYTYDVMERTSNTTYLNNNTPNNIAIKTIQYFDGLGRPSQTVQKGFSYTNMDVIKPYEYNQVGVDTINYLPYVGKHYDGTFKTDVKSDQAEFYSVRYNGDANGYSPTMLEKSPLQRILKQGAPGESWQISKSGHPVSFEYLTNDNSVQLKVRNWTIAEEGKCKLAGYYPNGELYVIKTLDEDSSATYEFKDKQGRVLLKRSELSASSFVDTYYIYDDFGLLRFVISPEGSHRITGDFTVTDELVKQYVYIYKYDSRKRLIEKKIPGKEPEYFIYNKADQVVLYQDGNMRKYFLGKPAFEWSFTKYDGLGRVVITGITYQFPEETPVAIEDMVNQIDVCFEMIQYAALYPAATNNYYTNNAFPKIDQNDKIHTISYYDSYLISTSQGIKPIVSESNMEFNPSEASFSLTDPELRLTSGMKTVSFIEYNNYLWPTVYYYDTRVRLIQERSVNHRKGMDINSQIYVGLTDKVSASEHKHSTTIGTKNYNQTEKYTFLYDDEKRLLQRDYYLKNVHKQKIVFTYSDMGDQVIKKEYYEETTLRQSVDYKYNIRGWLTKINDPEDYASAGDYFSMQLFYDQIVSSDIYSEPRYNGNISFIKWKSLPPLGSTNTQLTGIKGYEFRYDKLNRLGFADYFSQIQGKFDRTSTNREWITGYDKNGNITALDRHGSTQSEGTPMIDKLTYHYKGNQVIGIDDAIIYDNGGDFFDNGQYYYISHCVEYEYDANGNLTKDLNKGIISITYNELNLPETIDFGGNSRIQYDYDALGTKRRQTTTESGKMVKTIDFIGNFVYENDYPAYHNFDEGRIVYKPDSSCFVETYLKDHLGNIRVTYANDGVKDGIRQVNAYYPFGMNISSLSANSTSILQQNEYKYNGKMFQDELGLNWLDYGARFYDPVIGRWHRIDPLAHKPKNVSISPYAYTGNNPISRIDPDGRDWFYYQSQGEKNKTWHWQEGDVAKYTNAKGKEVTSKRGFDYLVTFKATGKNNEGAVTGTIQVWGDRNPNKGALTTVSGAFTGGGNYNFNPTQSGNYLINLSQRDSKGPQAMNAAKDNPVDYMGIQLIPNRYISEGGYRYDVGGAYGSGRIRLLETDNNLNISQSQVHGYYIHGKYDSHNWTHGCMCDKSGNIFNYFWSGAGKDIRGYVPVSVEY